MLQRLATVGLAASFAALLTGVFWQPADFLLMLGGLGLTAGFFFERFFARVLIVKEINNRFVSELRGAARSFWPSCRNGQAGSVDSP